MSEIILVLDYGTGGVRCSGFDLQGNQIAHAFEEVKYLEDSTDTGASCLSFDAGSVWEKVISSMGRCLGEIGYERRVLAISTTSQREGVVFLDDQDEEIYGGPNIDRRGKEFNRVLAEEKGEQIYRATGHWPEALFMPGRIRWFKENRPDLFKSIYSILTLDSWLLYKLSGKKVIDRTSACETLAYDINRSKWRPELLGMPEFDEKWLPSVRSSGSVIGELSDGVAEELNVSNSPEIVLGGADTQSAMLGMGLLSPGRTGAVLGTTAPVQMVLDEPIVDAKMRTWTNPHLAEDRYVIESNARITGLSYRWMRDELLKFDKLVAQEIDRDPYRLLNSRYENSPRGANGVLASFGPIISDVKNVDSPPTLISGLDPVGRSSKPMNDLVRAVLENVAFAIKGNILQIEEITERLVKTLCISGGFSQNRSWVKDLATIINAPVSVFPAESTAKGIFVSAATGIGVFSSLEEGVIGTVDELETLEPDGEYAEFYRDRFNEWKKLYEASLQLRNMPKSG